MFVFSEPYVWEGEEGIHQVLVFPNQKVRELFDAKRADTNAAKNASGYVSENAIGAIYKLRAVKQSNGKWAGYLRCGFTGDLLASADTHSDEWPDAIRKITAKLSHLLRDDFIQHFASLKHVNMDG